MLHLNSHFIRVDLKLVFIAVAALFSQGNNKERKKEGRLFINKGEVSAKSLNWNSMADLKKVISCTCLQILKKRAA